MALRLVLGGLVAVCAVLGGVLFVTYRQSVETADAVAVLKTAVERAEVADVPVRVVFAGANGTPLAGRKVYVWPRRIEAPPFELPSESVLWKYGQKGNEARYGVTLPEAYELLVTDNDGAANLGRRPVGVYTAAVDIEPELIAGGWIDEGSMWRAKREDRLVRPWWIGFVQRTFEVQQGGEAVDVAVRLPVLKRTPVRFVMPAEGNRNGVNHLWLAVRGGGGDLTIWLRAFEKPAEYVEGATELELPLPPAATLNVGYRMSAEGRGSVPVVMQADLSAVTAGEPQEVLLKAPRTQAEMRQLSSP